MTAPQNKPDLHEDPIREHTYDGIQEYDKRLPNWWLWTLYGSIIFSIGYWFYYEQSGAGPTGIEKLESRMVELEAARLAAGVGKPEDSILWEMSRNEAFLSSGRRIYETNCVACHGTDLRGGVGNNLIDDTWLHGGLPSQMWDVISDGVLEKGMPGWGTLIGERSVSAVTAYILSYHEEGPEGQARPR
ncbi:MAG: cytochrome C oxidase subunit III [Puniceicoccaceae bacterium]|nr:MAG: cytochrome C oxidase subunit III [Puniceicoccaceae bacterium]